MGLKINFFGVKDIGKELWREKAETMVSKDLTIARLDWNYGEEGLKLWLGWTETMVRKDSNYGEERLKMWQNFAKTFAARQEHLHLAFMYFLKIL